MKDMRTGLDMHGCEILNSPSIGLPVVPILQADYDALSSAEKMAEKLYLVTDGRRDQFPVAGAPVVFYHGVKTALDGLTPYISGNTGHWMLGDTDTGVDARGTDGTHIGTVISLMGATAPTGYLICDGSMLDRSGYGMLWNYFDDQFSGKTGPGGKTGAQFFCQSGDSVGSTGFRLPDLRNQFLRGYHGGAADQKSGEIGIMQTATKHVDFRFNPQTPAFHVGTNNNGGNPLRRVDPDDTTHSTGIASVNVTKNGDGVQRPLYYTSRPMNVAVLYCIKYI